MDKSKQDAQKLITDSKYLLSITIENMQKQANQNQYNQ